jgi:hypothetical protein
MEIPETMMSRLGRPQVTSRIHIVFVQATNLRDGASPASYFRMGRILKSASLQGCRRGI